MATGSRFSSFLTVPWSRHISHNRRRGSMNLPRLPVPASRPLFSFGLISDIQYADADPRYNFSKTEWRQYRQALEITKRAIRTWQDDKDDSTDNRRSRISFIIHCGDLIDGLTGNEKGTTEAERVLNDVLIALEGRPSTFYTSHFNNDNGVNNNNNNNNNNISPSIDHPRFPCYHMLGNHELYNFDRQRWSQELGLNKLANQSNPLTSSENTSTSSLVECMFPILTDDTCPAALHSITYYAINPHPSYLFIILDSYDISVLAWPVGHSHHHLATSLLDQYNPNTIKDSPLDMKGLERRWVKFGGGIGALQLQWLHQQLSLADERHQHVIIFSHIPLHPHSCDAVALCWNYMDVLNILYRHPCVSICFAGHDHDGGYYYDQEHEIYYVTVNGVISTQTDTDCFARVDCYEQEIHLHGIGMPSRIMRCKETTAAHQPNSSSTQNGLIGNNQLSCSI